MIKKPTPIARVLQSAINRVELNIRLGRFIPLYHTDIRFGVVQLKHHLPPIIWKGQIMGNAYNYHVSRTTVIAIRVAADTLHRLSVNVYCNQIQRQGNPAYARSVCAL